MQHTAFRWLSLMIIISLLLGFVQPVQAQGASPLRSVTSAAQVAAASALWTQDFSAAALPADWSVSGTPAWSFTNPGGRVNGSGGAGNFAVADSDKAGSVAMDTILLTPVMDLHTYSTASLSFKTFFKKYGGSEIADVDYSSSGGAWQNLWHQTGADFTGPVTLSLPTGSAVQVRFHYYSANFDWYWQVDDVKVEITSATPQPPSAPSGLTVTAVAAAQINLKWTDNSTDETGFKLEWSANGTTGWTQAAVFAANAATGADGTVPCATTRYYRVSAVGAAGTSAATAAVSATTTACPALVPAAPSGLSALVSGETVNLSWTDNSNNETGFRAEWSADGASNWTELSRPAQNATSASDSGLACGVTRYYRVLAYNANGSSAASASVSASGVPCPPPPPTAPSGLTAIVSGTNINLAWTDNSSNETGFKIERSADTGATWTQIVLTAANVTAYADTTAACGNRYGYRVRATNNTLASPDSAFTPAAETLSAPCAPVVRPTSLSESFSSAGLPSGWSETPSSGLTGWVFNDPGARTNKTGGTTGFAIIDSDKAGNVAVDAELRTPALDLSAHTVVKLIYRQYFSSYATSTADVDYSLNSGTTWVNISSKTGASTAGKVTVLVPGAAGQNNVIFRFRYYNATYAWYWQLDDVRVPGAADAAKPMAPSAASVTLSGADATVTWTDNSSNETSFTVERTVNGGTSWAEVGSLNANAVTFVNKNLACNTTAAYRVKALAATLASDYASTASVTTPACPIAATLLNENFNTSSVTTLPAGWFTETYGQVTISSGLNYTGGTGYAPGIMAAPSLRAPLLDLSALSAARLSFKVSFWCNNNICTGREATADLSTDGGTTWIKVWGTVSPFTGSISLDITAQAARKASVLLRFTNGGNILQIDDVVVDALPVPGVPAGLALSQTPDGVLAGWINSNSKYRVERSPDGSSGWTQVGDVTDGASQYLDKTVAANTAYFYRVSAYNSAGASAASSAASITVGEIGVRYTNVTISLYQGAPISTPAERAKYEAIIGYFADAVYEMSNGLERIGKVTIYRDKANFDTASIQWIPTCWPNANLSGFSRSGARVEMCDVFQTVNFLQRTQDGGYTIAHEWGHYFFGMSDEYAGSTATGQYPSNPLSTDVPTQYSVMNNQWNAISDLRWLNFSTAVTYSANTAQGRVFGASAWDTLSRPPAQDPYVAGYWTRLYWPELASVKPAAGQLPQIDQSVAGWQAKARGQLQVVWTPSFATSAPVPGAPESGQQTLSVVNGVVREIVVDTSSFVAEANLTEIKAALGALIEQAQDGDVFGLTVYDGTAVQPFGLTAVKSQADRDNLIAEINKLASGTSVANPGAALQAAYTTLTDVSVPEGADRVVYWITSGRVTTGSNPVSLVENFLTANIPLWIYGIAPSDGDQNNLRQLADMTGGSYTAVKNGSGLLKAFEQADQETSREQDTLLKWDGWMMDRGTAVEETVEVDATLAQVDFSISYDGAAGDLTLTITDAESTVTAVNLANDCDTTDAGTIDEFTTCIISFPAPAAGTWTISSSEAPADTYFMYYVSGTAAAGESTYSVTLQFPDGGTTTYPQPIRVEASIKQGFPVAGLNAVGYIFDPDGNGTAIQFRDDGVAPDAVANDGVYSAYAGYSGDGDYLAAVQFDNAAGTAYYTDAGLMTTGTQTQPTITANFERYAEAQVTVQGWQEDDHADLPDDPENPATTLALDNSVTYGAIDFGGDGDVFVITAPAVLDGPYALRINRLGLGMDPYVYVYAADGSWLIEGYLDFTPDSGDSLFVPLNLAAGDVVYVEVYHYDDLADSGVYAISAGKYQATDATAAARKPGFRDLYMPVIRR
jgi:hypothetical protein